MTDEQKTDAVIAAIQKALQDRQVSVVADVTGLAIKTIRNVQFGGENKPKKSTVSVLANYLKIEV
jgi:hypothetical protein